MGFQMRKLFYIILLLSAFSVQAQDFYGIETVNTIELFFTEQNWDEILDSLVEFTDEERLIGTALVNGEQFDSVGVRYKGNSSYNPNQVKNPLNIKLDHIIEDQDIEGYGTLKLANCYKDPSFIREVISYEMTRSYMPASLANFANVYINGDLIGLYSNVQSVDKKFLDDNLGENDNAFFKGELVGMGPILAEVWGYMGPDSSAYFNYYELRSDSGWSDLIDFLDLFNNEPDSIEAVLNVDQHLWMLAIDNLMVNLDAPINFAHNFYLYQDNAGRFNPFIWDLNENFGAFSMLLTGGPPLNFYGMQHLDPFLNLNDPYYPIINKVLSNDEYAKRYIAHMKTIIGEYFENDSYIDRALEIQTVIDQHVQNDPNKFYSYYDFTINVNTSVGFGPQAIVGIQQLMDIRIDYLLNRPDFNTISPEIGAVNHIPEIILQNSEFNVTAEVEDASVVDFVHRNSGDIIFTHQPMFDDGLHGDVQAGDGIFGAYILAGWQDIEYYIYGENAAAASFMPPRAEFEFNTLEVNFEPDALVINEFMADNDSIIADPQGDFDDWIEIYNGGDDAVNLSGIYLTDDLTNAGKWAFPDTIIEAGGFIIVWADEDVEDEGLHANFRLAASGEEIGLVSIDGGIVQFLDQVVFGAQETDIAYGRYPDGGETWQQLNPTPGTSNQGGVLVEPEDTAVNPADFRLSSVYPNPFNQNAAIIFTLEAESEIELAVFDVLGRQVSILAGGLYGSGSHNLNFNGEGLSSGIYFVVLEAGGIRDIRKLMLLR